MKENKVDVVVLGCGLSGMITALAFAYIGKKVAIIGELSENNDNRTTALTKHSWQFLSKIIDNIKDLEDLAGRIADIYVLDNKACNRMLHFPAKLAGEELLGYIIKNTEFKELLYEAIKSHPIINIFPQTNYKKIDSREEGCRIYLNDQQIISSDMTIICSGINSAAYKRYFQPAFVKYYHQTALTFNVIHEKQHEGVAVEHFMQTGPFAILPLKDPCGSSIVWSLKEELAKIYAEMPVDEFTYHVQRNFGEFLGNVKLDSEINYFPLKSYLAEKYFYKRMVLAADSAHIIHPLAGQGLNQGIKDIETLSQLTQNSVIDNQLLVKYQKLRQNDNIAMYLITDNLNRIFSNYNPVLSHMRQLGLYGIDKIPLLKNALMKYAYGQR